MARFAAALCAFLLVVGAGPSVANTPQSASEFIGSLSDTSFARLTEAGLTDDQRAQRFRELFEESFAVQGIARFVMGRHWRGASAEQRTQFTDLFVQTVVGTWANRFRGFSGLDFEVTGETEVKSGRADEKDAIVRTAYLDTDGPVAITWRVANKGTIYKITDVQVEGVSMVTTYREEIATVIRRNGNTVDGLLTAMRKNVENVTDTTL